MQQPLPINIYRRNKKLYEEVIEFDGAKTTENSGVVPVPTCEMVMILITNNTGFEADASLEYKVGEEFASLEFSLMPVGANTSIVDGPFPFWPLFDGGRIVLDFGQNVPANESTVSIRVQEV